MRECPGWTDIAMKRFLRRRVYMNIRRMWVAVLFCVVLCGLAVGSADAQSVATISGTVLDASAAALAGAQVTAHNEGTSQERVANTDGQGHYVISLLPIGKYTVSVAANGFQKTQN